MRRNQPQVLRLSKITKRSSPVKKAESSIAAIPQIAFRTPANISITPAKRIQPSPRWAVGVGSLTCGLLSSTRVGGDSTISQAAAGC